MSMRPSRAEQEAFQSLVTRNLGFRFGDDKLAFLAQLLTSRTQATRSPTVAIYLERVAGTKKEIAILASTVTVTETYFQRNQNQFEVLKTLLRDHARGVGRHLSILSAGSSSGEEAYSIAIAIHETIEDLDQWTISISGVDLDPEVIAKARLASYPLWSLRETPDSIRKKYFQEDRSRYLLSESIRRMVRFEENNLVRETGELWRSGQYHIVFCRNVLMYFSPEAAREVIANIACSLAPGGHLFLGHAENLRGVSNDFHLMHTHDTFYYQRRDVLEADSPASHIQVPGSLALALDSRQQRTSQASPGVGATGAQESWFQAIAQASRRIETLSRREDHEPKKPGRRQANKEAVSPESVSVDSFRHDTSQAMALMKQERFQEALRLLVGNQEAANAGPDELLLRAMLLASTGELADAEKLCRELLAMDELNAGAHYIMAICREHTGDRVAAIEHSRAAAYLDSKFAMPHLQLGRLARRMGDVASARRELNLALSLLACEDAARITLFGGGFGREVLMELCLGELDACGDAE